MACNDDDRRGSIADDDSRKEAPVKRGLEVFIAMAFRTMGGLTEFPIIAMSFRLLGLFLEEMPISGQAFSINQHVNNLKGDVEKLCGVEEVEIDESLVKFFCEVVGKQFKIDEIRNEGGSIYLAPRLQEDNKENPRAVELLDRLRNLKFELRRLDGMKKNLPANRGE